MDWTYCEKRLPPESEEVLCCTDLNEIFIAELIIYDKNDFCFDDGNGMFWEGEVIKWMPLPEINDGYADKPEFAKCRNCNFFFRSGGICTNEKGMVVPYEYGYCSHWKERE